MASNSSKLLIVLLVSFLATPFTISARKLDSDSTHLKLDEEGPAMSCFEVLLELQSCSSEVVMFFLNGETHLGANCCRAISTIQHHCWPSMLGSLGITTEENNILRGYCDAVAEDDGGSSSTPPPAYGDQGHNNSHA